MLHLLQPSAVQKMKAHSVTTELVRNNLLGSEPNGDPWVFQGFANDEPFRDPEGTGKSAVVLTSNGTWGSNDHNTAKLPLLNALVYTDCSRRSDGTPLKDSKNRSLEIASAIEGIFHDPANRSHLWPMDLRVLSCVSQGVNTYPMPDKDYMHRSWVQFYVALG